MLASQHFRRRDYDVWWDSETIIVVGYKDGVAGEILVTGRREGWRAWLEWVRYRLGSRTGVHAARGRGGRRGLDQLLRTCDRWRTRLAIVNVGPSVEKLKHKFKENIRLARTGLTGFEEPGAAARRAHLRHWDSSSGIRPLNDTFQDRRAAADDTGPIQPDGSVNQYQPTQVDFTDVMGI
jgi:hypothetical protein